MKEARGDKRRRGKGEIPNSSKKAKMEKEETVSEKHVPIVEDQNLSFTESLLEKCKFVYEGQDMAEDESEGLVEVDNGCDARESVESPPNLTEGVEEGDVHAGPAEENSSCRIEVLRLRLMTGQDFASFRNFEEVLEEYCKESFTNVRKRKSWTTTAQKLKGSQLYPYRRVEYKCVNYGFEKKQTIKDGSRPNQSYCATGCLFEIHVALNARKQLYEVKKSNLDHVGHTPSRDSFMNYRKNKELTDEETEKYIKKYMIDLKVSAKTIAKEVQKDTGKIPSRRNLRRFKQTFEGKPKNNTDMQQLIQLLERVKENDDKATVKIAYANSEGQLFCEAGKKIVKVIFFQTGRMKELFAKHGTVLSVDGTYNLCNNQYVLVPFHIIDNHLRTRVCGFSLLSNETSEVMRVSLQMFKEANDSLINNLRYMIVDKDFVEIAEAGKVFPGTQMIICQWHAMRRVDSVIHRLSLPSTCQHLKSELMGLFKTMVKTSSEKEYFAAWDNIVKKGQQFEEVEPLVQYLAKNWHAHRDLFATYKLETYPLYLTFTNNRSENFNMQLKKIIQRQSPVHVVVEEALEIAQCQETDAVRLDVKSRDQTLLPTNVSDPSVIEVLTTGRGLLSHETLQKLRIECEKACNVPLEHISQRTKSMTCTLLSGPCTFAKSFELPCCHLLATRKANGEPLLEREMISSQWIIDSPRKSQAGNPTPAPKEPLFIQRNETARKAKFRATSTTMKEMASALAQFSEEERSHLTYQLELLMNAWNNGIKTKIDEETVRFLVSPKKPVTGSVEDLNLEDIIFSPKKENRMYRTSAGDASKKAKKSLFPGKKDQEGSNVPQPKDDEEWQQEVVKMFKTQFQAEKNWVKSDFEKLSNPNVSGTAAYLNDKMFHYVLVLMRRQFPHIKSLQDTVDYKFSGFKSIDPSKPFLQPTHSGALHWALLSNICLSQEEKESGTKVCLYDSMVHLSRESDAQAEIPSAVSWQVAQLYRKESWTDSAPIDIYGMPCAQQENGFDCGMHVIMNMTALAFGHDPSQIAYKSNGRIELLDMIQKGRLRMFEFEKLDVNGPLRSKFTVLSRGRLQKRVLLTKTTTTILPLCQCQLPESWDNIVFCSQCSKIYHQGCHFMGISPKGKNIADIVDPFICFSCREPGIYYDIMGQKVFPDLAAIEEVCNKIDKLESHKLCAHVHKLLKEKKDVPRTISEFTVLGGLLAKYDLNVLASKNPHSRLYVSLKNFYQRYASQLPQQVKFESVSSTNLTLFALSIICDIEQEECPPVWVKNHPIVFDESLSKVYSCHKTWICTIDSSLQALNKKLRELENKKNDPCRSQDLLSFIITGKHDLRQQIESLNGTLAEADAGNSTKKQIEWRQDTMLKLNSAMNQLNNMDKQVIFQSNVIEKSTKA